MPKPTELEDFIATASRPDADYESAAILRMIQSNPIITPKVFSALLRKAGRGDVISLGQLFTETNTFLLEAHKGVPTIVKEAQSGPRESWERQGYARM